MAFQFTAASSQYLSCPITSANVPLTIACWVYPTILGIATAQFYVEFGPTSSPANRFAIGNATNSSALRVTVANNSTNAQANTTALLSLNNWNHVAGVFSSSASRTAYLNGGNAVTNTTSLDINASNEATGTASSTLGAPTITEITCGSGAIDGIVAGDAYRLRITREQSDTTNDTMTGAAQVFAVELRSAA